MTRYQVIEKVSLDVLLDDAPRDEAVAFADTVTGRPPGSSGFFLGRRDSVYVQARGGRPSVIVRTVRPVA